MKLPLLRMNKRNVLQLDKNSHSSLHKTEHELTSLGADIRS